MCPEMSERKSRILLVDDEMSIVKMVGKRLQIEGYEVAVAMDGEEAVEKAQGEPPDLIVLDLMLPKRSGMEVCVLLRKDERFKETPIIFYSGRGQDMSNEELRGWGANSYVTKVQGTPVLVKQIHALLDDEKASGTS